MSISNNNGRVLEYLVVEHIKDYFGDKAMLTENTIVDQERDKEKIEGTKNKLLDEMDASCQKIVSWLDSKLPNAPFELDRLRDGAGMAGDVTDIRIIASTGKTLNLSLKHNHLALKHQRPGSTAQQLGFQKKSKADTIFRASYAKVFEDFRRKALALKPDIELYREIQESIPDLLYEPMCNLVSSFINQYGAEGDTANHFLKFLVGNTHFKKIVVYPNNVIIQSYDELPNSPRVTSELEGKSYIVVNFHNGIILKMRLHTASSRFSQNSLKFDTQADHLEVPTIEL